MPPGTTQAEQPEAPKVEPSCWLEKALQITPTHAHSQYNKNKPLASEIRFGYQILQFLLEAKQGQIQRIQTEKKN